MSENKTLTIYTNPPSSEWFRSLAGYTLADGTPAIDVVCLFAANYASATVPYLRAHNNQPPTQDQFNPGIQTVLSDGSVQYLQDKGITVLLSVLNGHAPVGWSEFTKESDAQAFAQYMQTEVVNKYGLDGIDIDDEYSAGQANDTSLIMVTTLMKQLMPDKLITKALWSDSEYFQASWQGHTLAENLDYGWEMSYFDDDPSGRLTPYTQFGANHSLNKNQLSLGFSASYPPSDPAADVDWLKSNGYLGVMVFNFEEQANIDLAGSLVNAWYGSGNWNPPQS